MKKIKICGITREEEIEYLNEAGVDYAGFVQFYPKSKRNVSLERAKKLREGLSPSIQSVAVTVSPTPEQLRQIEEAGFDLVQIHADVSDETLDAVKIPVWKAFNVQDLKDFERFEKKKNVVGFVLDAQTPGSGKIFDWNVLRNIPRTDKIKMLAGGLNPDNVAKALSATGADGADTSSGVERDDKTAKDRDKILAFAGQVRTVR